MSTVEPPPEFESPQSFEQPPSPYVQLQPPAWTPPEQPPLSPERRRRNRTIAIVAGITGGFLVLSAASIAAVTVYSVVSDVLQGQHSSQNDRPDPATPDSDPSVSDLDVNNATARQKVGVVTIVTELYYDDQASAAGTGIILSPDGQILTNNHVVAGSTAIEVTIESTGKTYKADVVGTDATNDVALLQLVDATGLKPMRLDEKSDAAVNDEVASIGNANGTGDLVVAEGRVVKVHESLTIGGDSVDENEFLKGLIEIDADVVSGDSGGPLVDADGEVIGMVTAASSGDSNISGYAITIGAAMDIIRQIQSGKETETVRIGPVGFMGVLLAEEQGSVGVTLESSIADSPAEKAGLTTGDVITSANGVVVNSADELTAEVRTHDPGETITILYMDAAGLSHSVDLVLVAGPAV